MKKLTCQLFSIFMLHAHMQSVALPSMFLAIQYLGNEEDNGVVSIGQVKEDLCLLTG